jgi:transposase-like protein
MIDFPIDDLLDEAACRNWLENHLHPEGVKCPKCGTRQRRLAQQNGHWPAWRCQACDQYYTLLSGTVFEKTRQSPAKLVLLLRGIAKGESTACLARELRIGRVRLHELRQQIQRNLLASRPTDALPDDVLEADELFQNAGEKRRSASRPRGSAAPPRQ